MPITPSSADPPVFVVTHDATAQPPSNSVYTLVTDGVESVLERAQDAAGPRDVRVMGGASIGQQFLEANLIDEIVLHVVPVLLKAGTPMFEHLGVGHVGLEVLEVTDTPAATHLRYRVLR